MYTPFFSFCRYACLVVAVSCGLQACTEKSASESLTAAKAHLDKGELAAGIIELKNASLEFRVGGFGGVLAGSRGQGRASARRSEPLTPGAGRYAAVMADAAC
jgi:hypothetical protein